MKTKHLFDKEAKDYIRGGEVFTSDTSANIVVAEEDYGGDRFVTVNIKNQALTPKDLRETACLFLKMAEKLDGHG